jgi:hypothetical protein
MRKLHFLLLITAALLILTCQDPTRPQNQGEGETGTVTFNFGFSSPVDAVGARWAMDTVDPTDFTTPAVTGYVVHFISGPSGVTLPADITMTGPTDTVLAVGSWSISVTAMQGGLIVGYNPSMAFSVGGATLLVTAPVYPTGGGTAGHLGTGDLSLTVDWSVLPAAYTVAAQTISLVHNVSGTVVANETGFTLSGDTASLSGSGIPSGDYRLIVYLFDNPAKTGIPLAVAAPGVFRVYDGAVMTYRYVLQPDFVKPRAMIPYDFIVFQTWNGMGINWTCADLYETGYQIYRQTSIDPGFATFSESPLLSTVAPVDSSVNSGWYEDIDPVALAVGTYYRYRVVTVTANYGTAEGLSPITSVGHVYVSQGTGNDTNNGWPGHPFATLEAAQAKLTGVAGNREIRLFAIETITRSATFNQSPGISLIGGYDKTPGNFFYNDPDQHSVISYANGTMGTAVVSIGAGANLSDTQLINLSIVRSGTDSGNRGVSASGGSVFINNCRIDVGASPSGQGVYLNSSGSIIVNSVINGGSANGMSYAVYLMTSGNPIIANNAINGGTGTTGSHYGIYINNAAVNPTISGNIIYYSSSGPTGQYGIYRESTGSTITLTGNVFSRCDSSFFDYNGGSTEIYSSRQIALGIPPSLIHGSPNCDLTVNVNPVNGEVTGGIPLQIAFGGDSTYGYYPSDRLRNPRDFFWSVGPREYTADFTAGSGLLTVNSLADTVDGIYTGAGQLTLREAIALANAGYPAHPETQYPNIEFSVTGTIPLSFGQPLNIERGINILGPTLDAAGNPRIILSGDIDGTVGRSPGDIRILEIDDRDDLLANFIGLYVSRLTFSGGLNTTGGAFRCLEGGVTFYQCRFENNYASNDGAVYNSEVANLLEFAQCRFIDNYADYGGVIALNIGGSITNFQQCLFDGNGSNNNGGVVFINGPGAQATFSDSIFVGNYTELISSGSIAGVNGTATTSAAFNRSTFYNNTNAIGPTAFHEGASGTIYVADSIVWGGVSGNLYQGSVVLLSVLSPDSWPGSITADPCFVNTSNIPAGLALTIDSPALDAGTQAPGTGDYAGNSRGIGLRHDIGAYESPFDIQNLLPVGTPVGGTTNRSFTAVAVSGDTLYLGMSDNNIYTCNIGDPNNPGPLVALVNSGSGITKLMISGDYVYVLGATKVQAFNRFTGAYSGAIAAMNIFDIDIEGTDLYIVSDSGISRYTTTSLPGSLPLLNSYTLLPGPLNTFRKVDISGNYGILMRTNGSLVLFDTTDLDGSTNGTSVTPPTPVSVPSGISFNAGLTACYISAQTPPQPIQTCLVNTATMSLAWGTGADHQMAGVNTRKLHMSGTTIFAINADNYTLNKLTDISAANDGGIAPAHTERKPVDLATDGNWVYVVEPNLFQIFDVSGAGSPVLVSTVMEDRGAWDVADAGNYAYVANGPAGFSVWNISDPLNPVLSGRHLTFQNLPPQIKDAEVQRLGLIDHYLILVVRGMDPSVTVAKTWVLSFDITNPSNPVYLDYFDLGGTAFSDCFFDSAEKALYLSGSQDWGLTINLGDGHFFNNGNRTMSNRGIFVADDFIFFGSSSGSSYSYQNINTSTRIPDFGSTFTMDTLVGGAISVMDSQYLSGRVFSLVGTAAGYTLNIMNLNYASPSTSTIAGNYSFAGITPQSLEARYPYAVISYGNGANSGITFVNMGDPSGMGPATNFSVSVAGNDFVRRTVYRQGGYFLSASGNKGLIIYRYQ